jgi:hypothetical protein
LGRPEWQAPSATMNSSVINDKKYLAIKLLQFPTKLLNGWFCYSGIDLKGIVWVGFSAPIF